MTIVTRTDKVLAHETRLDIVLALEWGELRLNAIQKRLGASDGSLQAPIEHLKKAGYVAERAGLIVGKSRYFRLTREGREALSAFRARVAAHEPQPTPPSDAGSGS